MKLIKRILAAALAAVMLLILFGCAQKDKPGDALVLTEAQKQRICTLAGAFLKFGPCDMKNGMQVTGFERIIYCLYTNKLGESEAEGYGKVTVEETDEAVDSVFKGIKILDIFRTKYDVNKEQELYRVGDYYYVRLSNEDVSCDIRSAEQLTDEKGRTTGVKASVAVSVNGVPTAVVTLEMPFEEKYEFSVTSCSITEVL